MEKIMEIPGGRGSNTKPPGTENPVGWGIKLEKTLRGGGMDIFWNHTMFRRNLQSPVWKRHVGVHPWYTNMAAGK